MKLESANQRLSVGSTWETICIGAMPVFRKLYTSYAPLVGTNASKWWTMNLPEASSSSFVTFVICSEVGSTFVIVICHLSVVTFVTLAIGIRILSFFPKCWIKLFLASRLARAWLPRRMLRGFACFCVPFCFKEFLLESCIQNLAVVMHFPEIAALRIKGG